MRLMEKMGWKPGQGLGKDEAGQLEPLALDVKSDKRGLEKSNISSNLQFLKAFIPGIWKKCREGRVCSIQLVSFLHSSLKLEIHIFREKPDFHFDGSL
jgi:hypothetical protein